MKKYDVKSVNGEERLTVMLNDMSAEGYEILQIHWVGGSAYRIIFVKEETDVAMKSAPTSSWSDTTRVPTKKEEK